MARGNQRDKAREKNLKEQAGKVCLVGLSSTTNNDYISRCSLKERSR